MVSTAMGRICWPKSYLVVPKFDDKSSAPDKGYDYDHLRSTRRALPAGTLPTLSGRV
jgi:hypothetical protein